jgi:hypothetical protein
MPTKINAAAGMRPGRRIHLTPKEGKAMIPHNSPQPRDGKEAFPEVSDSDDCVDENGTWQEQDEYLNEALEETFPASDPISPSHVSGRRRRYPGDADVSGC